jgi:hypothetical protein
MRSLEVYGHEPRPGPATPQPKTTTRRFVASGGVGCVYLGEVTRHSSHPTFGMTGRPEPEARAYVPEAM